MTCTADVGDLPRSDVVRVRRGLPRVAGRLAAGQPVTVAWFGGSVTYGAGLDEGEPGYRGRCIDVLRSAWAVPVRSVNAAIGGTGSDLGCFRLRRDALSPPPDLVVVEFSVNDAPGANLQAAYEGVLRAVLATGADVLTVYAVMQSHLERYDVGELPEVVAAHDEVAAHYGVPSVNVGAPVAAAVRSGRLAWEQFATDVVHPTAEGHRRYAQVLADAVLRLVAVGSGPSCLPPPLTADPWDDADLLVLGPAHAAGGWSYEPRVPRGGWECFSGVLVANGAGRELELAFDGPLLGLFHTVAADTGCLDVQVDDAPWRAIELYDHYGATCTRPHYRLVDTALDRGPHVARVRVGARAPGSAGGSRIELHALLVRGPQR